MLTPEYLLGVALNAESMYAQLNRNITNDIVRRVVKTGEVTPTAAWQTRFAQESGAMMDEIVNEVARYTGLTEPAITQMFLDAGTQALKFDAAHLMDSGVYSTTKLSPAMNQILNANIVKTQGELSNLSMTTANTATGTFEQAMNEAIMKVQSGAFDWATALRDAVDRCAREGATVLYPSGAQISVEAACRMNLLTAINQTASEITKENCRLLDTEFVETSAHVGARPTHQEWQGQVFHMGGPKDGYDGFEDATALGEPDGLCGVNCRHSYYPFIVGISERNYTDQYLEDMVSDRYEYNGKKMSEYDAEQYMRGIERSIRQSKRLVSAYKEAIRDCENKALKQKLEETLLHHQQTLNNRRARYTDFSRQTGLQKDYLRTRIGGQSTKKIVQFSTNTSADDLAGKSALHIPLKSLKANGVNLKVWAEMNKGWRTLEKEYDIRLGAVAAESYKKEPGSMFLTGFDKKDKVVKMVVNTAHDFESSLAKAEAKYAEKYFAGRNIEDYLAHEAAHVMLLQDCKTSTEVLARQEEVNLLYDTLKSVSGYAGKKSLEDKIERGAEALAEAFVRVRNGEDVSDEIKKIVEHYYGRYRK